MRSALNLLCIVICLSIKAQDQTRNFSSYTTMEGLSNNWAPSLIQDSRKFLWIGTKEGLNRFDGHSFKKYFNQQNTFNSLSNNNVFHILEYKYGQLLIATNNGLSVLNTLTGQFENEKIDFAPLKAGSGNAILCVFKIAGGQIWANHNGEIDVLDSNLKYLHRFTDIPWAKSLKGSLIYKDGQTDSHQRVWLTTDTSGVQIIDFSVRQVYNYKNNPQQLGFLNATHYIRTILLDEANHVLWYAPWGSGLIRYDLLTNKEQQQLFGLKTNSEFSTVNAIVQKDSLHLLCAAGDGMYEVDINSLSHTKVADKIVGAIFIRTAENQFWAGTGNGIIRLNGTYSFISELSLAKLGFFFEKDDYCTGITVTQNGMLYCSYRNNRFLEIDTGRASFTAFKIQGRSNIFLTKVCEDKAGQLWVGTSEGIFFFDRQSKKFSRPAFQPYELYHRIINVIYCDHNGDVWIGTRAPFALYKFSAVKKRIEKITNEVIDQFTAMYSDSRVSGITEDNKNNMWMYSMLGGGIINYNKVSGSWKIYPVSNRNKSMIVDKAIASFYAGENNNLWFSNYQGNGLICYNYLLDSITLFKRSDGLASDYIQNLVADHSNNLWLSTDNGFTKFDLQNRKAIPYDLQNALTAPFFYEAIFDPVTSRLVYAMPDRLLFISTGKLEKDSSRVVPIIDNISVNNKEDFSYAKGEKAMLKHNENNISIEFTGVNFSTTHHIQFAHQLIGLDTGWKISDVNRSAQYSNLPSGDYTFSIKTASENGEWSKAYKTFAFTIRPAFWQTAWFMVLSFLTISLLAYLFYRYRVQQLIRMQKVRNRIATDLHDEIGSNLTNISILSSLSKKNLSQPLKANNFLQRISEEVSSSSQALDDIIWSVNASHDTLEETVARMRRYAAELFDAADIRYELYLDPVFEKRKLMMEERRDLYLLYKEAVNNISKHAGAKNVNIQIAIENNQIMLCIKDDGKGFETEKEYDRHGLKGMKERVEKWKGKIIISSVFNKGSSIEIRLPVSK
ncbi:MAG: two-component regulator propeller domain-containing protein [Ferruginibacter sp.]